MTESKVPQDGFELPAEDEPIVGLPIRHRVQEGQPLIFANNMVIQHTADEFIMSFFQVSPPIVPGAPDELRRIAEELGSIDAFCVARIVITPAHMKRVVDAIGSNWERYKDSMPTHRDDGEEELE